MKTSMAISCVSTKWISNCLCLHYHGLFIFSFTVYIIEIIKTFNRHLNEIKCCLPTWALWGGREWVSVHRGKTFTEHYFPSDIYEGRIRITIVCYGASVFHLLWNFIEIYYELYIGILLSMLKINEWFLNVWLGNVILTICDMWASYVIHSRNQVPWFCATTVQ